MEKMGLNEIREAYLDFFESKGHLRLSSFSLVPKNDKSLLLINAGMAPMKPYFTGMQIPPSKRVTTCQKCIRTGDIDNVGKTSRHVTFFEMLGNFSFGDYFKKEAIPWAWEFITDVLKLPKDRLYVTIYLDDDEAFDIWTKSTDIEPSRIFRLGKKDNFWEHGEGPCGPCSEIHFDKGEGRINTLEEFIKCGDEDRVIEFWNLVFTQFDKDDKGNYNKLSHPNIDTGMGLERIAAIMQGKDNIFEIDTMKSILDEICRVSSVCYGNNKNTDVSLKIITDHIRSIVFLICDGVLPSNEGRGYVLRRLLRRAAKHGKSLGINRPFLSECADVVIDNSCGHYPELKEKKAYIKKIIAIEEKRFDETIDSGIQILNEYICGMGKDNTKVLSGEKAFKLYDTFGFPLELTEEMLQEKNMTADIDGFNKEMQSQKEKARAAREECNYMGMKDTVLNRIPLDTVTKFDGYDKLKIQTSVKVLVKDEEFVSQIEEGSEGVLITEITPFYAEMGGQVGDTGIVYNSSFKAVITDCKNNISGKIMHFIKVIKGKINIDDDVTLEVDETRRNKIRKNHTATHLLDAALRKVLGQHVHQNGSFVDDEKLRFDFTHFAPLSAEEIKKVEDLVNENIMDTQNVNTEVLSLEEARKTGAVALFDEKYGSLVRVVSVGDFSKEFCGGTHIDNSGKIGLFKIISENGIAAGVRRIEAVTGFNAIKYMEDKDNILKEASEVLKCSQKDLTKRINIELNELKEKDKEIEELKGKLAGNASDDIINNVKTIKGIKLAKGILKDVDGNALRDLGDRVRSKIGDGAVVVLGSNLKDKVQFVVMASKSAVEKGIHCGKIIKEIAAVTGGGGGGRPDMAQAGGKNPQKLQEAMDKSDEIVESLVK